MIDLHAALSQAGYTALIDCLITIGSTGGHMKPVQSVALSRLFERFVAGQPMTRAGREALKQMEQGRQRFHEQRQKMQESMENGARLTGHRITL